MANYVCPKCGSCNTVGKGDFLRYRKKIIKHRECLDCKHTFREK